MWGVQHTSGGHQTIWCKETDEGTIRFPLGTPKHTDKEALAYARRLQKRYPNGPASLLSAPQVRREVVVTCDGETYRFPSKAEARRVMRTVLQRKRLPPEIVDQIEGR